MGRRSRLDDDVAVDMSATTEGRLTVGSIVLIGIGFAALVLFINGDRTQSLWLRMSEVCYLAGMLGLMFAHPRVHDNSVSLAKWLALLSLLLAYIVVYVVI
jgi:hypothetical protein